MAEPGSSSRRRWFAACARSGGAPSVRHRSTRSTAGPLSARGRSLWLSWSTLDGTSCGSVDSHPLWRSLPSSLYPFLAQPVGLDLAETPKASKPTRRVSHRPVVRPNRAHHQKKVAQENRTLVCIDEAAFYLLPSVGYTWAPQGQTPILSEVCSRDHLSAIRAITPQGKLYLHLQEHAFDAMDVVGFLCHLLGQIPGKLLVVWDRAPIHINQ